LLHPDDDSIVAIATDAPLTAKMPVPVLDLNRPDEIAAFVVDFLIGSDKAGRRASHSQ
jgi:molybdopterin-guanine dinucleotide biosynthesis protein B